MFQLLDILCVYKLYAKLTPHYEICYVSDQLAYIVVPGLDPALPDFNGVATDSRLDPSDAEFVDCIHTCGGLYGFYDPLCDLDFYPNRGQPVQPGCWFFHLVGVYSLIALNFYVPTGYSLMVRFEILKNVKSCFIVTVGFLET